jgi:hypothetical protein
MREAVPGIPAAHVLAHFEIRVLPEAGQIARHLQRTTRRRQQFESDRHGATADARRRG